MQNSLVFKDGSREVDGNVMFVGWKCIEAMIVENQCKSSTPFEMQTWNAVSFEWDRGISFFIVRQQDIAD